MYAGGSRMMYIALRHIPEEFYYGDLKTIHDEMEDDASDPDDFEFYEVGKKVAVVYEKRLVLIPTGVKKS
jgi:hypothetical protein